MAKIEINRFNHSINDYKHLLFPATENNDEETDSPHFHTAHSRSDSKRCLEMV